MKTTRTKEIKQDAHRILDDWLKSCTRHGNVARNTVAVGIVALDHLRQACPVSPENVLSDGGELTGARSGLGKTLESYGIPSSYLKEATSRQAPQDGRKLLEQFQWGERLAALPRDERDKLLLELIGKLKLFAMQWLQRQNLKLNVDRHQAPTAWVQVIVENAKGRSGGVVEQHLVGAKLERRFKGTPIENHPVHAGDQQTDRPGDFVISNVVYHVTAAPSRSVLGKCAANTKAGLHPVLLVPREQEAKARVLAQVDGIDRELAIISIEDFVAFNIIELATEERRDFFVILKEIVEIYNRRLAEVETDLSLQIQVK